MPFAQPAHAAAPANIEVETSSWDYQGKPWVYGQPGDPNAKVHTTRRIVNHGGSPSGAILVWTYCGYPADNQGTNEPNNLIDSHNEEILTFGQIVG